MKIIAKREADLSVEDFADMVRKGRVTKLLSVGTGKPEWGAEPGRKYYILHIKKIDKE